MAIPYRTAKLKSANAFAMAIWDPTAKFNSLQYFRLYGMTMHGIFLSTVAVSWLVLDRTWMARRNYAII